MVVAIQVGFEMSYPLVREYRPLIRLPPGQRPFRSCPELDGINHGDFIPPQGSRFSHWGAGSYAVVFRIRETTGNHIALRCLIAAPPVDVADRYHQLEMFRKSVGSLLPYFVRADFVADAISVNGQWFPVFLMEWIGGVTLGSYVESLALQRDKPGLRRLADDWSRMITDLQHSHVAHGDLQHGNAIITERGEIRLVDYDTVYVPSLAGRESVAIGTPGYVHPCYFRGVERPYSEKMDTFSALVIYLSLRALAVSPELYGVYSSANLLLADDDLFDAHNSRAFQALVFHSDQDVAQLARVVRDECLKSQESLSGFASFSGVQTAIPRIKHTAPEAYEPGASIRRGISSDYSPGTSIPRESSRRNRNGPPKPRPTTTPDYKPGGSIPRRPSP